MFMKFRLEKRAARVSAILVVFALLMVLAVALGVFKSPTSTQPRHGSEPISMEAIAAGPLPKVEPLLFAPVDPKTAQGLNAAIPFVKLGADRPSPFVIKPDAPGYERALDCLASAVLYEAGDDPVGQAAVAQVIINRMRHPAFPHSVCEVVYQGSERSTGCQFTFTCDGALSRIPSPAAWKRASETAAAFLAGKTYPKVGMATHYHTDWVHPYWSPTLDKIAQVGTHLFFRWRGTWGRKVAFASRYTEMEPVEQKLAFLSAAHGARNETAEGTGLAQIRSLNEHTSLVDGGFLKPGKHDHFILVDGSNGSTSFTMPAMVECKEDPYCKVVAWDRRSERRGSPRSPNVKSVAFVYVSDEASGSEIVLWDCERFPRPLKTQCLSDNDRKWITL